MRTSRSVALFQHEQPSAVAWDAVSRLCREWNARSRPRIEQPHPFMWMGTFDDAEKDDYDALVTELDTLVDRLGVVYQTAIGTHLEESDYAIADFIQILGVGLGSEERPFLLNRSEAIGPPEPCPDCGAQGIFEMPQTAPYHIDESLLDGDTVDERLQGSDGWDVVNLANGQILVSDRFREVLEDTGASGYELIAVTSGDPPRPSERMFQLVARHAVLVPCLEHSRFIGLPPCPTCGFGRGVLEAYFWVRADWVDGDDLVSRHRRGAAHLYVRRRVYDALVAAGLNGLHRNDVMRVCRHPR
jgi:hypothetical protein